jgi:hypothetical protein
MGINKLTLALRQFCCYFVVCLSFCLLACSKKDTHANLNYIQARINDSLQIFSYHPIAYFESDSGLTKLNLLAFQSNRIFSNYIHVSIPLSENIYSNSYSTIDFIEKVDVYYFDSSSRLSMINHVSDIDQECYFSIHVEDFNANCIKGTIESRLVKMKPPFNDRTFTLQKLSFSCPRIN